VLLFGVVLIQAGEGACARPGRSGYPHYCSLLTRVDSAEADKVGSQIRFCAYAGLAIDEGVRHYRTTPGALFPLRQHLRLLQALAATAERVDADREVGVASALSAGVPGQACPPSTCPSPRDHSCPPFSPSPSTITSYPQFSQRDYSTLGTACAH
jgi:hypothetical protein